MSRDDCAALVLLSENALMSVFTILTFGSVSNGKIRNRVSKRASGRGKISLTPVLTMYEEEEKREKNEEGKSAD